VEVGVSVGVSVGRIGVLVGVGDGVSVFVSVTGAISVMPGTMVCVNGWMRIIGVAVTMLGVREGGTIQVATGCGETPKASHALRMKTRTSGTDKFFMFRLYTPGKRMS
jgi:hypothetical protein